MWLYHRVMSPNDADGMAQSRPRSDCSSRSSLIWVCTVCSDLPVRKLRIITVSGSLISLTQITQERDDEGFGGNTDSQINGNARTPLACCTISRTTSRNWFMPLSAQNLQDMGKQARGSVPNTTFSLQKWYTGDLNGGPFSEISKNLNRLLS